MKLEKLKQFKHIVNPGRRNFLKKAFAIAGAITLSSLAIPQIIETAKAQTYTPDLEITKYTYVKPFDALVFREGPYAVAIDRKGRLIAKSTDHAEVIQKAINYAKYSDIILICEGKYYLNVPIVIKKPITLIGIGTQGTEIEGGDNIYFDIQSYYVKIIGIYFVGANNSTYTSQIAIKVNNVNNVKIIDCIFDGLYRSIWFSGTCFYEEVFSCFFYRVIDYHIYADERLNGIFSNIQAVTPSAPQAKGFMHVNKIDGIIVSASKISGHYFEATMKISGFYGGMMRFTNVALENVEPYPALVIEGTDTEAVKYVYVNTSYIGGGGGTRYAIELSNVKDISIVDSHIVSGWRGILLKNTIERLVIKGCKFDTLNVPITADPTLTINGFIVKDNYYYGSYPFINFATISKLAQSNIIVENNIIPNSILLNVVGVIKNNIGYPTENHGVVTVVGDGSSTSFVVDVGHGLVSDRVVARVTLDREGTVDKVYLVDKDGDGFKETLRIQVTFATAPASGEEVPIYWEAEIVQ